MPYDPGISYHGDQYAYQGIQALGTGLRSAFDDWQKKQEKDQELAAKVQGANVIVEHAAQTGLIPQADYLKYQTADAKGKLEISQGLAQNIATDSIMQQRQQAQAMQSAQILNYGAETGLRNAQAGNITNPLKAQFVPSDADKATAAAAGKMYVAGAGGFQLVDAPDTAIDPAKLRMVTIQGSATKDNPNGIQVVVDEHGKQIPNSKLQGAVRPQNDALGALAALLGGGGGTFPQPGTPAPPAPAPNPAPVGGIPRVQTVEQAKALPVGTVEKPTLFYDPNGILRVR